MKHIVGFSGGIDSQACALWVRNRFPAEDVILLNTNAGRNESPLTEAFVRHYSDTVFPVQQCFAIPADFNTPPFTQDGWAERRAIELVGETGEVTFEVLIRAEIHDSCGEWIRLTEEQARFLVDVLAIDLKVPKP